MHSERTEPNAGYEIWDAQSDDIYILWLHIIIFYLNYIFDLLWLSMRQMHII